MPIVDPAEGATTDVTTVVVTWQGAHLLGGCLDSLAAQTVDHTVIVIDNASTDGTEMLLQTRYPQVRRVRLERNTGFAGGVAAALDVVETPLIALLNNDAVAAPEWLERSLDHLRAAPGVAAVTARMLLWDGGPMTAAAARINNAGGCLTRGGYGADRGLGRPDGPPYDVPAEVFGFSGGAAVLRTPAVRDVGGMPAEFFLYYEDTDLSWRLRLLGWRIAFEPSAVVWHRHAASSDPRSDSFAFHNERNRLLMLLRCAPIGFTLLQLGRFCLTTASLAGKRALRRPVPPDAAFQTGLRMRVLGAVLAMLPWALRTRRQVARLDAVPRRRIIDDWLAD